MSSSDHPSDIFAVSRVVAQLQLIFRSNFLIMVMICKFKIVWTMVVLSKFKLTLCFTFKFFKKRKKYNNWSS